MPEISMTDFVDFVIKVGPPKLTKVRAVKARPSYSPALDFWKPLRDGIRDYHKSAHSDRSALDAICQNLTDPKKRARYPGSVAGYKRFLGRKRIAWFDPPSNLWSSNGLDVRVNPELGLTIDGQSYIIKLYFKDEAPTPSRLQVVLELMSIALPKRSGFTASMAVLDVSNGKLILPRANAVQIGALLSGEAAAFVAMWNSI